MTCGLLERCVPISVNRFSRLRKFYDLNGHPVGFDRAELPDEAVGGVYVALPGVPNGNRQTTERPLTFLLVANLKSAKVH